jgi:predicted dehydrogenase
MKKINVGVIGAGSVAKSHAVGYTNLPMYLWPPAAFPVKKVICDVREDAAKTAMERYSFEEYSTDWQAVVNRKDIDLIDILVPNELHAEIAIAAAKAGKMIYCEKPMALDLKEAQAMVDEAEKAKVRTAVGYNKRRFPAVLWVKKLIDEGVLGDPISFHGVFLGGKNLNPDFPYTWRLDSGVFRETGCHIIDLCYFLFGDFEKVTSIKRTIIKERPKMIGNPTNTFQAKGDFSQMIPCTGEDFGTFTIQLKNGAVANFENSTMASGNWDGLSFEGYCTKGGFKWDEKHPSELQLSLLSDPFDQKGFRTIEMGNMHPYCFWPFAGFGINWADLKTIEINEMLDAFVNDKPFTPDFKDALKIVKTIQSIYESTENDSKWVDIG